MRDSPDWWQKPRAVAVVVDTPGWFDRHAAALAAAIGTRGDQAALLRSHEDIVDVDVAFYLSCMKIVPAEALAKARVNLVAHASDLPKGRGFSPVVWQILEGAREIPIRLLHAVDPVDSGDIVLSDSVAFEGHELNDEIRDVLGRRIVDLCLSYLVAEAPPSGRPQHGEPSWYVRRGRDDSRLDPQRSIADQFDLLRVVDNTRYPAFFELRGHRYIIRIEKMAAAGESRPPRNDEDQHD
jgi:methionyl-tRNA formyltransferase